MPLTGEYAPSRIEWARKQAELFERTNGAEGNLLEGRPIVLMTSIGAASGKLRKTPLMRVEHEGQYAVVASHGGSPKHPSWYHNVVDAPFVELQDGPVRKDYAPRVLSGEERAVWWERAVEVWPPYTDYQTKTDRLLPVILLTAVE